MRRDTWMKSFAAIGVAVGVFCFPFLECHSDELVDVSTYSQAAPANPSAQDGVRPAEPKDELAQPEDGNGPAPAMDADTVSHPSKDTLEALDKIEKLLSSPSAQLQMKPPRWKALDDFQQELWKGLALDPIAGVSPDETQSQALTKDLETKLANLIASPAISQLGAKDEFEEYAAACQELLELRKQRLYREARRIVRTGKIDRLYHALVDKISKNASVPGHLAVSVQLPMDLEAQLRNAVAELKSEAHLTDNPVVPPASTLMPVATPAVEPVRTPAHPFALVLANCLWLMVSIFAFFTGRNSGKKSPDHVTDETNRVTGRTSIRAVQAEESRHGGTVTAKPTGLGLDYNQWMRRYETALAAKKDNERKDQDFIKKLNHFSWSFSQFYIQYHLEPPTADIEKFKKELQEQSTGLKELIALSKEVVNRGDRSYREILEQLLELCDSIEGGSIKLTAPDEPPVAA